jgi:hypothetical protein
MPSAVSKDDRGISCTDCDHWRLQSAAWVRKSCSSLSYLLQQKVSR